MFIILRGEVDPVVIFELVPQKVRSTLESLHFLSEFVGSTFQQNLYNGTSRALATKTKTTDIN